MVYADVLSAVRSDVVHVTCCERRWELQRCTAAQWAGVVAYDPEGLSGVFPGLILDDDLDVMMEFIFSVEDIEDRWARCARHALQRSSGRDWWWSLNLIKKALRGGR